MCIRDRTSVLAPVNTSVEVQQIMFLAVPIIFLILILTTNSWFEPVLFMITIGVAILINRGTNLMFGTVSFVTNAAGSVLQLAVSMDYSIFLLHRFSENREEGLPVEKAMIEAVKQSGGSILSSGLTTVTGFLAQMCIRDSFKGAGIFPCVHHRSKLRADSSAHTGV